jgi:Putative peptidoglycan binding domain/LysM domain
MAGNYTVKQGDHLSSIAAAFGFSDYHTIWDDANNAALKQKRQTPNVLFPGDLLYIPDHQLRVEARSTDVRHKFVIHRPTLMLRLILEDSLERPIANAPCDLLLDGEVLHVTTDGRGRIEQKIRPETHRGTLIIRDPQTPFSGEQIPIRIGNLNPAEEISGQVARLDNLGYYPGDGTSDDDDQFESAVEEFQCDNGLTVDGICGPLTQAKLKQVHGC